VAGLVDRLLPRRKQQSLRLSPELADAASNHLLEMDERLEQLATLPGLEAFATTRRVPREFFTIWDQALAAYDRFLAVMTGPGALAIRCQAGCSACCHEVPTGVQAVELLAIYERYRQFDDFAQLHNRACDLADHVTELIAEQAQGQQTIDSTDPAFTKALMAYRSERKPCVFLGPDSRCRIYDRRPIPCRMHFAVTDPRWCEADHPNADQAVTPNLEPPQDMLEHMRTVARRLGLERSSPLLFQGLGLIGGQVMQTKPLRRSSTRRHGRG